jgi:hypothetical protein
MMTIGWKNQNYQKACNISGVIPVKTGIQVNNAQTAGRLHISQ